MSKYGTVLIADDNTSILTAMRYLLDGTFERILTLTQPDDILKTMDGRPVKTMDDLEALYKKALDGLPARFKMDVTVDRRGRELHFVLNYLLFMQLGIIGPAIASLITILLAAAIQMLYSCHLLRCKLKDAFDLKHVSILLLEMLCIGGAVAWSRRFFDSMHYVIRLMICGLIMGAALGLLNWRRIRRLIVALNHL